MSPLAPHAFLGMPSIFMLNFHLNKAEFYFFTIPHVRRKSGTTFSDISSLLLHTTQLKFSILCYTFIYI